MCPAQSSGQLPPEKAHLEGLTIPSFTLHPMEHVTSCLEPVVPLMISLRVTDSIISPRHPIYQTRNMGPSVSAGGPWEVLPKDPRVRALGEGVLRGGRAQVRSAPGRTSLMRFQNPVQGT